MRSFAADKPSTSTTNHRKATDNIKVVIHFKLNPVELLRLYAEDTTLYVAYSNTGRVVTTMEENLYSVL